MKNWEISLRTRSHAKQGTQINEAMVSSEKSEVDTLKNSQASIPQLKERAASTSSWLVHQLSLSRLTEVHKDLACVGPGLEKSWEKLNTQLQEFGSAQLLFRSPAPLWRAPLDSDCSRSYSLVIASLNQPAVSVSLLETAQDKYFALQTQGQAPGLCLLEPGVISLQFLQSRSQFLQQLRRKYTDDNRLCELSEQILFLYQQLRRRKQSIMRRIREISHTQRGTPTQEDIKRLLKQLKTCRRSKSIKS